jgi:hypothetical protein
MKEYLDLVTSEHAGRPKYMAMVEAYLQMLQDVSDCFASFDAAFALETAEGKQLDILGEIVGRNRLLPYQPQFGSAILNDDDYRFMIRAKIVMNQWDGTRDGLVSTWHASFPDTLISIGDGQDMSAELLISGIFFTDYQNEMITNDMLLPRPEGVLYTYTILTARNFAYDALKDLNFGGYDEDAFWDAVF